jgi:hypothetical protein
MFIGDKYKPTNIIYIFIGSAPMNVFSIKLIGTDAEFKSLTNLILSLVVNLSCSYTSRTHLDVNSSSEKLKTASCLYVYFLTHTHCYLSLVADQSYRVVEKIVKETFCVQINRLLQLSHESMHPDQ